MFKFVGGESLSVAVCDCRAQKNQLGSILRGALQSVINSKARTKVDFMNDCNSHLLGENRLHSEDEVYGLKLLNIEWCI
jgi:hypothetical protein